MPRKRDKGRKEDDDLMTTMDVRRYFGGNERPISLRTLQQGIDAGRIPKALYISPQMRRWRRSEVVKARARMVGERPTAWPKRPDPEASEHLEQGNETDG